MPALPPDKAYEGWFVSDDGSRKESVGILLPNGHGVIDQSFFLSQLDGPTGENLFSDFATFVVTIEPVPDPDPGPSAEIAVLHSIPAGGLVHIRHLLFSWVANPPYDTGFHIGIPKGIAVGLREQTFVAFVHSRLSLASSTLADVHLHACHMVNVIEGIGDGKGENFDASCGNPGDGFGVLGYAQDAALHAAFAAAAAPDAPMIVGHSARVINSASNAAVAAKAARDLALLALGTDDPTAARLFIGNAEGRLNTALAQAVRAYHSAQEMGTFIFGPPAGSVGNGTGVGALRNLRIAAFDSSQPNDDSESPSISAGGRFVVLQSFASNLVPGDTNGMSDIFLHDRQTNATKRISVSSDGSQANDDSMSPVISANGRIVAFQSYASNLVPGDTNLMSDIFVYDRGTGRTERVSVSSDGSQSDDDSRSPSVNGDGRIVAFQSFASNLAPGETEGMSNIFVHDKQTGVTERIAEGLVPSISADGRFVAYQSLLSDIFVHDSQTGKSAMVSLASDGSIPDDDSMSPSISADGRFVAFQSLASDLVPGDSNGMSDIFVHDMVTGITERVSVSWEGSQANDDSESPSISRDGWFVAYQSFASNLAPANSNGILDIFVHDRRTGRTLRISVASDGSPANDDSESPSISADGGFVAFQSFATNLLPGDTTTLLDVFALLNRLSLKPGDADGNGVVDVVDLRIVTASLATQPGSDIRADLNNDGLVDVLDLVEVAINLVR